MGRGVFVCVLGGLCVSGDQNKCCWPWSRGCAGLSKCGTTGGGRGEVEGEVARVKGGGQKADCTVRLLLAAPPYHESTLSVDTAS